MKKTLLTLLLGSSLVGCSLNEEIVPEVTETKKTSFSTSIQIIIDHIYDACMAWKGDELPSYIIKDKIAVIRFCDLLDTSGDFVPELDGYENIKHILWPNGYGK